MGRGAPMGARVTAGNFRNCLTLTLAYEGGYVNHPKDPGGATNKGVTQKVYDSYRQLNNLPNKSVAGISFGEAAAIYRQQFWAGLRADQMPDGVDYAVFDYSVNSGVFRASCALQRAIGVGVDGHIGVVTLARLNQIGDLAGLVAGICADRLDFVRGLSTFDTFGAGWVRRIAGRKEGAQADDNGVIDYAVNMITKSKELSLPKPIGALVGEPQTARAA